MANTLNRIGILLNFLAGFMIAPELIGLARIRRWGNLAEDRLVVAKKRAASFLEHFSPAHLSETDLWGYRGMLLGALLIVVCFGCVIFFIWTEPSLFAAHESELDQLVGKIFMVVLCLGLGLFFLEAVIRFIKYRLSTLSYTLLLLALSFLFIAAGLVSLLNVRAGVLLFMSSFTIALIVALGQFAIILASTEILGLFNRAIASLENQDALQGYIVAVGLFLYVSGNVLQLLSTF